MSAMGEEVDQGGRDVFWANLKNAVYEAYSTGMAVLKLNNDKDEIIEKCLVMGKFIHVSFVLVGLDLY